MNIGIIGYGSMGKMLAENFLAAGVVGKDSLYLANRTLEKLQEMEDRAVVCKSNAEVAERADFLFLCVRPADIKIILEEIADSVKEEALVVSLNGSVSFAQLEKILCKNCAHKIAKMIPSVTAEINRSQSLVCCNKMVKTADKAKLCEIIKCLGEVIELPENEIGMGSELVSCMPGFIASIFDVICKSAKKHTELSQEQIVQMVLKAVSATSELMLQKDITFENVVSRVATKGGITEEGAKVIYEGMPEVADLMFEKTLEKRKQTTKKAEELFSQE